MKQYEGKLMQDRKITSTDRRWLANYNREMTLANTGGCSRPSALAHSRAQEIRALTNRKITRHNIIATIMGLPE